MKVFSKEKYLRSMDRVNPLAERRNHVVWPFVCDGKTKEECDALGYLVVDEWMEEKGTGYKEKQAEWLMVNNLREGSRVYVYRKPEDYEDGWAYMWIDDPMYDIVGKVANIVEVTPCSLKVEVGGITAYMPYSALLPVGVTGFEVGLRYKYVGDGGAEVFKDIAIPDYEAEALGQGCELMVEEVHPRAVKFTAFDRGWSFLAMWKDFVALPEKDYYAELNRLITANDLKVGDRVRLLRSPTLEDVEGWGCDWDESLDEYVGRVGVVDFYYGDNDIIVTFSDGEETFVPYTVLEKMEIDGGGR